MSERDQRAMFPGDTPFARAVQSYDWAASPIGDVDSWPELLRSAVATVWPSALPMMIWWGDELTALYNEAFVPLLSDAHPAALGASAESFWAERGTTDHPGALRQTVIERGEVMFGHERMRLIRRGGLITETYWTSSCSAIRDEKGDVAGVFVSAADVTDRMVADHRAQLLAELATISSAGADRDQICRAVMEVVAGHRDVVPAAAVFLTDEMRTHRLTCAARFGVSGPPLEGTVDVTGGASDIARAFAANGRHVVDAHDLLGAARFEAGPIGDLLPHDVLALALTAPGAGSAAGVLVLALSPYQRRDASYEAFARVLAGEIGVLLADAAAFERETLIARGLAVRSEERNRFFQNVSHEFRTPLTLIQAPMRDLLENTEGLPQELVTRLEVANRAADRLERLVDGLLEFARADVSSLSPELEPTNIALLTRELAGMFGSAFHSAAITLNVDIQEIGGLLLMDPDMYAQIELNLMSNALKYTPSGGRVDVSLGRDADELVLTVLDTGVGIPPEEQQAVFERFRRLDAPVGAEQRPPGLGIGLALVSELVVALDGRIELTSEPGQGSCFSVRLPAVEADWSDDDAPTRHGPAVFESVTPAPVEVVDAPPVGDRRILLVEDDPDLCTYLSRLLTEDGWTVDAAGDVASALKITELPDLVLSDVMLPGERDGLDLVRALREIPALAHLPVILLTARSGPEAAIEGLNAGADDYVRKPFHPRELLARLNVHHELSRLREFALSQAEAQVANLRVALASNRRIGAAIGVLMQAMKITDEQAFLELRTASQHRHMKLREVAEHVLLTGQLPPESVGAGRS
jgi:signal transduction histidine kinase/DNA-binding response OmpR family regulator